MERERGWGGDKSQATFPCAFTQVEVAVCLIHRELMFTALWEVCSKRNGSLGHQAELITAIKNTP